MCCTLTLFLSIIQCMIGHGEIGMPVLIKGHRIIPNLERENLESPLKITITTFQVKDSVIHMENHSIIELDDEVHIFI